VISDSLSGKTARHLLSFVVLIPLVLGLILSYVTKKGMPSQQVAAGLSMLLIIVFLMIPHASPRAANPPARGDT
jgi:flagellar biosynthesis protein FliP